MYFKFKVWINMLMVNISIKYNLILEVGVAVDIGKKLGIKKFIM